MRVRALAVALLGASALGASCTSYVLYVDASDPTCGGNSPCFTSIQQAIDEVWFGQRIWIREGVYHEQLSIEGLAPRLLQRDQRVVIEADPRAPVGSVVIEAPYSSCTGTSYAINVQGSENITLRGLTITGAGGPGVALGTTSRSHSGPSENEDIRLERLRIYKNGCDGHYGAIFVDEGNVDILVVGTLVHHNDGPGLRIEEGEPSSLSVVNTTVYGNLGDGFVASRESHSTIANTAILDGGGYGVAVSNPGPGFRPRFADNIALYNSAFCGNADGELAYASQILDDGDEALFTPTGTEGGVVQATPNCVASVLFPRLAGSDGVQGTEDDDFGPGGAAAIVDSGRSPLGLFPGLPVAIFSSDYVGTMRPFGPAYDIGALELFDDIVPNLSIDVPSDGSTIGTSPTFRISYSDPAPTSGLDLESLSILLGELDLTDVSEVTENGATYVVEGALEEGEYELVVSIADNAGNTATAISNFTVDDRPFAAIADCAPTSGTAPLTVRFQSRADFPSGSIERYRWDFDGDGTFDVSETVANDYLRTFSTAGVFGAVLEVTNNFGDVTTDSCTVTVEGNAPTAQADASPSNGPVPLDVDFTCTGSDPDGSVVLYEWDFDGDGTYDFSSPTSGAASNTYATEGLFIARCRVTDDEGKTGTARATTTVIRPAPPGSPTVTATANPASGSAPLQVNLGGTATDDGSIVLYEWDFDGDGTFDFSSPTSPQTTSTYTAAGIFGATLRATDNDGNSSSDTVAVTTSVNVDLSVPTDTFAPEFGETGTVSTTQSADLLVKVLLKNEAGDTVRTLFDGFRPAGTYQDVWGGNDDGGVPLPNGPYYAVLEYDFAGDTLVFDETNSTGGVRRNPPRNSLPRTFSPFEDDYLDITFTLSESSEVLAFVGLFFTNTRFNTLVDRVAFPAGTHTLRWDGTDMDGNIAVAPPGDTFLFGIFSFSLPDNAVFLQRAPVVSGVEIDPNFFNPTTPDPLTPNDPVATVTYDLDREADVMLIVTNLATETVLRTVVNASEMPGVGKTISWDGRTDDGRFADAGNYRVAVQAQDSTGSKSMALFGLVRVFH